MFTVILVSNRTFHRFEQWKVLFEPFEEEGLLKVCGWNRGGADENLSEIVPELSESIHGKSEWRAIVVDTVFDDVENDLERNVGGNPFDFLDNLAQRTNTGRTPEQLNLEPSLHPVIHLAHLLLGYPDITPKDFLANPSYWDPVLNRRVYQSEKTDEFSVGEDELQSIEQFRAELGGKHDVQIHYRELPYTSDELKTHRKLADKYRLFHVPPKEVIFLATREPSSSNPIDNLRRAWSGLDEYAPSRFIERNDYPPSCRFVVHDLPRANDNRYQIEKMRLWLGVLSLACNKLSGSALQAERVYGMEVKIDETALSKILNEQLTQLTAEREFVDEILSQPRRSTDSTVEEILHQQQPVRVAFDEIGGSELSVSIEGYSLASDRPRRESIRWQESINELRTAAESFTRRPRRALSRSVLQVRNNSRAFRKDEITLDDISLDELEEELVKQSQTLAQPTSQEVISRVALNERIERHDRSVRRAITRRMEKRTILAASATVALAWVFAFVPYLVQAAWNATAFIESLFIALLTLGILGTLGIATLLIMKARFLKTIQELNSDLRHYVSSVSAAASEFTSYLTSLLTFMRGQAVLISTKEGTQVALRRKREMEQMRKRIVDQIIRAKSLIRDFGQEPNIEKGAPSQLRIFGTSDEQVSRLFHWPTSNREMLLNITGEKLKAPYDVIQHLVLSNLDLQEPKVPSTETGQAKLQ